MNIKNKISVVVSVIFTVLFAVSATIIYVLFADFRKDEFESRLNEKAISSIKLLVEVNEVDNQLLKIIDQNSINKLYNEKTLIFDANYNLIYSSLDDTKVIWSEDDLKFLKKHKTFLRKNQEQEIHGFFYDTPTDDYFALISASDEFGTRKLNYLLSILITTYFIFTIICWFSATYIVQKLLIPLDVFHNTIKKINENTLDVRISVKPKKDEIDLLAHEFNLLLHRLNISYQKQKDFTAHASHELRTPIARLISQIENKILDPTISNDQKTFLQKLINDTNQLSELITSLLTLSKIDTEAQQNFEIFRIDELILEAAEKTNRLYPSFTLNFNIDDSDYSLEVKGNRSLWLIAFSNLLRNAYLYSDNQQASVTISAHSDHICVEITNNGLGINPNEQESIFEAFTRAQNSQNKSGLGLGLRIVNRITQYHQAKIKYQITTEGLNSFSVLLPC